MNAKGEKILLLLGEQVVDSQSLPDGLRDMVENQREVDADIARIVNERFWEMYEPIEPTNESGCSLY